MLAKFSDWLRHIARRKRWTPELALGRRGEDLAHRFLRKRGYTVVARNYRLAAGDAEADIIAWQGDMLVVIEVKSRRTEEYGSPERAVGLDKVAHLQRIAREYTRKTNISMERVRFDLVTVVFTQPPELQLSVNAFGPT